MLSNPCFKGSCMERSEYCMMNSLNHLSINRLTDVIEDDSYVHLVVEYVEGQDLLEEVFDQGPFHEHLFLLIS